MSLNIVTIVGARPQFIKAAPVSAQLRTRHREYLVHTGQHYDANMSQLFFDELGIPQPDVNLEIGSGAHGEQTAQMLVAIEKLLEDRRPDLVLVYGDTNSTLAGALAAAKLNIAVAHVEAGLRSFNRKMPEEINRILTDRMARHLFCPTRTAVEHLKTEGVTDGVYLSGDVMYDAALHFAKVAESRSTILEALQLQARGYLLATCHRPQNTDHVDALRAIVQALIDSGEPVVFPVHPRTRGFLQRSGLIALVEKAPHLRLIDPVGYLDMVQLERHARKIVTDSGGVQKEAYFYRTPCITLRDETEWVETVADGWNVLVGARYDKILAAIREFVPQARQNDHYGDGCASAKIVGYLNEI